MKPEVQAATQGLPLGGVRYFDRIGSTNDEALRWVGAGAPDLALVVADEQTAGRGRLHRRWFTPPQAALAFSLALRQPQPGEAAQPPLEHLTRFAGLGAVAAAEAVQKHLGLESLVKWPNDVLLSGRKVCGVLPEAVWQGGQMAAVVIGIGINVHPAAVPPAEELLFPATSLEGEAGHPVDRWELLREVLERLIDWRARLSSDEFLQAWEARLAYRDQWVRVVPAAAPAPVLEGRVLGLAEDGSLRLLTVDGSQVSVNSGEVRLRPV